MREEVISTLLGYMSIACWLGAQFPQIVVNWRRKSVDGLALPFLANWFLGDATNLIGCLLTDQLPFQTILATYFVFVDVCLVSQFLHYDAPRRTKSISVVTSSPARHSRTSLLNRSPLESHAFPRRNPFRSHSASHSSDPTSALTNVTLPPPELDYRHESFLVSEGDEHSSRSQWQSGRSRRASSLMGLPESVVAEPLEHHWRTRRYISLERDDAREDTHDAESESTPSVLMDSSYSEGGRRVRGRGKHVSWTRESPRRDNEDSQLVDDVEPSSRTAPSTTRGRQLTRPNVSDSPVAMETPTLAEVAVDLPRARRTSGASAVSASASRRSASIVFLAVVTLFTFSSQSDIRRSVTGSEGRVLSLIPRRIPDSSSMLSLFPSIHSTPSSILTASDSAVHIGEDVTALVFFDKETRRIAGRLSAWTCTTLYLTSRLPQIWKNFARQSVEGLSMYLFIFAFLGNFFYVLSILSSPKMDLPEPQARQFIRDSVPYLLGSGGTLLFDITILLQSLVYDPRRRSMRTRRTRRQSLLVEAASEEEARVLLEADHNV